MRVLALETTERIAGVAVLEGGTLLAQWTSDPEQRSAQSLAPGVKTLLDRVGWKVADVELVAVSQGPGSFTGLRVGVTTAKALAYAAGANVLGVNTLEAIAAAAPPDVDTLEAVVDAQRGEVVAGRFARDANGHFQPTVPERLLDADAWLAGLPQGMALSGPILGRLKDRIRSDLTVLPSECWLPSAAEIGRIAVRHHAAGRRDDLWTLAPRYSRRAAAEEKWDQREGS